MRMVLAIVASLVLTGCAVFRHDAIVEGIFPDESEFVEHGVPVEGEWVR